MYQGALASLLNVARVLGTEIKQSFLRQEQVYKDAKWDDVWLGRSER
jgi:hypothetical protein